MAFSTSLEGIPEASAGASDGLVASEPDRQLRRKRSGMVVQASSDAPASLDVVSATRPSRTRCRIHPMLVANAKASDTVELQSLKPSAPKVETSSDRDVVPPPPKRLKDRASSFARKAR